MKTILRIWIFLFLWRKPNPWVDGTIIHADFAWELAGVLAEYDDELSQWEDLSYYQAEER